jgi:predicted amino acid racemase
MSLKGGTLTWLRTRIVRIEAEIAEYEDSESVYSGEKILKLANETLRRAEVLAASTRRVDTKEVLAIEDGIKRIIDSQWGCFEQPQKPY